MNRSEITLSHANLWYMTICWPLNIYGGYTYEYITAGGPWPTRIPTFQSVFSPYCSTTYQTLLIRSMQTLYDKNNIVIAHTLLYDPVHGPPF